MLVWPLILQAVLKMLNEIGTVENISEFIEGVKARWLLLFVILFVSLILIPWMDRMVPCFCCCLLFSGVSSQQAGEMIILVDILVLCFSSRKRKLSGFGHRVYKNYDPRAKVLKRLTEEVFSIVGWDPLIEVLIHFVVPVGLYAACVYSVIYSFTWGCWLLGLWLGLWICDILKFSYLYVFEHIMLT